MTTNVVYLVTYSEYDYDHHVFYNLTAHTTKEAAQKVIDTLREFDKRAIKEQRYIDKLRTNANTDRKIDFWSRREEELTDSFMEDLHKELGLQQQNESLEYIWPITGGSCNAELDIEEMELS